MTNHDVGLLTPVAQRFETAAQMLEELRDDLDALKRHRDSQREHSKALESTATELVKIHSTLEAVLTTVVGGVRSLESATAEAVRFLSMTDLNTMSDAVTDVANKTQSIQDSVTHLLAAAQNRSDEASSETQQLRDALSTLRGAISTMPDRALRKYGLAAHVQDA